MMQRWMLALALWLPALPLAAEVKRVVVIKLDGVPAAVMERELARIDPVTGKSTLPWIDRVFEHGGTHFENFYVRGITLSAPSWSLLDTGQHMEIHGNAEFDRYTNRVYDYLNFFPFYVGYALSHKVDMPAVEVMDDLGIPLLADHFPAAATYQSFQLFQRGVRWKTLQHSLQSRFSHSLRELLDEWTIGFEIGSTIEDQTERELIAKLADPQVRYLDYFTGDYDHVAHSTPDPFAQRLALQRIDAMVGRIWTAVQASALANQTLLVMVSDHGMNTTPGTYSQGYDLVQFFNSRAGGAHHVVTNRHPLSEYKLKGLDPFVSQVVTPSQESPYVNGASSDYPTALLDLDGNERAAIYLRNSDFNTLQLLLQEINRTGIQRRLREAAIQAFLRVVDDHRGEWQVQLAQLTEELAAVRRRIEAQRIRVAALPKKWSAADREAGLDKEVRRASVQLEGWREEHRSYSEYAAALSKLLSLKSEDISAHRVNASDLIPKRAMGDSNMVRDLQNYVAGLGPNGLVMTGDGLLDFPQSFRRIDYFSALTGLSVRNNVQAAVGPRPVDFIAMRIPRAGLNVASDMAPDEDPVWLYATSERQALILTRHDMSGGLLLRYVPIRGLRQNADGAIEFATVSPAAGFPLKIFEDPGFGIPEPARGEWLNAWHSERDWLDSVYRTTYSNAVVALEEQFRRDDLPAGATNDADLLTRFEKRRRHLAESDFLIFANDHWNFNVRGFNPGGNHGSFFRISSRSVLMMAGGSETGVPQNRRVDDPYDSLDFAPTILELMGLSNEATKLPGHVIREVAYAQPPNN